MKKALVTFLALFTCSAVVFISTLVSTSLAHTDNSFEVQNPTGDPAAAQNLQISMVTDMNQQLHWDTTLTLGAHPKVDTRFRFTPEQEIRKDVYADETQLEISTSFGANYSENIIDHWNKDRWRTSPYETVILDVCSRAPATGVPYTEIVRLTDYLEYYPIRLVHSCSDLTCWHFSVELSSVLSIPIPDHVMAEITVTKEPDGSVFQYSLYLPDVSSVWVEALYFEDAYYVVIPPAHLTPVSGEGGAEPGLYRLPLTKRADGSKTIAVSDITLEFPFSRPVESIYLVQDKSKFLLVSPPTQTESGQVTLVDVATREILQQLTLEPSRSYAFHAEEDHLVYLTAQDDHTRVTAWVIGTDGLYSPMISASIPGSSPEYLTCHASLFLFGQLYILCNAWNSSISSFDIGVFDATGMLYYATYVPNQSRDAGITDFPLHLTESPLSLGLSAVWE